MSIIDAISNLKPQQHIFKVYKDSGNCWSIVSGDQSGELAHDFGSDMRSCHRISFLLNAAYNEGCHATIIEVTKGFVTPGIPQIITEKKE